MSIEEVHEELAAVKWAAEDDVTRALFFHAKAFKGMEVDGAALRRVMQEIGEIDRPGRSAISFDRKNGDGTDKEKALHRLIVLGVVSDYTVDYAHGEITVELSGISKEGILQAFHRYIACYQRAQAQLAVDVLADAIGQDYDDFVQTAGRRVIRFVYEVIERSRRQALSEMLQVCDKSQDEQDIRDRILRYLGTSAFTERIEKVVDAADAGLASIPPMLDEVRSAIDAGHLRGEVGRALESYPDHAGLRLLRGVAEAMTAKPDMRIIRENIEACVDFATSKYDVSEDVVDEIVTDVVRDISDRCSPHLARVFLLSLLNASVDKSGTARRVIAKCPPALCNEAVAVLLSDINAGVVALIER
jgi:ATP-dependent DNA helicase RecQ